MRPDTSNDSAGNEDDAKFWADRGSLGGLPAARDSVDPGESIVAKTPSLQDMSNKQSPAAGAGRLPLFSTSTSSAPADNESADKKRMLQLAAGTRSKSLAARASIFSKKKNLPSTKAAGRETAEETAEETGGEKMERGG